MSLNSPPAIASGIEVSEFCSKWMPVLYRRKFYQPNTSLKFPGDTGFTRQAAIFLVSLFPGTLSVSSVQNYLSGRTDDTPTLRMLQFLLGQLDKRWSSGQIVSLTPIADLELFCHYWIKIWWGRSWNGTDAEMARFLSYVLAIAPKEATSLIESSKVRQSPRLQLLFLALALIEESWQSYIYRLHYNPLTFRKRA